jgi:hypothetical protein
MHNVLWIVMEIEIEIINFMSFFGFVFNFIFIFFGVSSLKVLGFEFLDL